MQGQPLAIHWFRRDLRLEDNTALFHALESGLPVLGLFIFDTEILDKLNDKCDARLNFIHQEVLSLKQKLESHGSSLLIKYGKPSQIWKALLEEYPVKFIFLNHDYEPYALQRDLALAQMCSENKVDFKSYKDQVLFEKSEIVKDDQKPYTVFTPYSKKWKLRLQSEGIPYFDSENHLTALYKTEAFPTLSLKDIGFERSGLKIPARDFNIDLINRYTEQRNYPSVNGSSKLSIHFRFGTISIRKAIQLAMHESETWLNELIWREFYMMILFHFPHVVTGAFKPQYDRIPWLNNEEHFALWCEGKTGYPLVDAGMRELNATGFMHNRVRMVVASFLCKHLLIDYKWGEAYFAEKLLDFELASNNGGWQWAAGSGVDAAPYFRIFNPSLQAQRFDKERLYMKQWIPELDGLEYPREVVPHVFARERCLATYKQVL